MLRVQSLTKQYTRHGNPAIQDVSFDVNDGEIVSFVGLNAAGKTTTIRIGCGVTLPSSGSVSIDGLDIVKEKPQASKYTGWVLSFRTLIKTRKLGT